MTSKNDVCPVPQAVSVALLVTSAPVANQVSTWTSPHLSVLKPVVMVRDTLLIVMMATTSMETDAVMIARSKWATLALEGHPIRETLVLVSCHNLCLLNLLGNLIFMARLY